MLESLSQVETFSITGSVVPFPGRSTEGKLNLSPFFNNLKELNVRNIRHQSGKIQNPIIKGKDMLSIIELPHLVKASLYVSIDEEDSAFINCWMSLEWSNRSLKVLELEIVGMIESTGGRDNGKTSRAVRNLLFWTQGLESLEIAFVPSDQSRERLQEAFLEGGEGFTGLHRSLRTLGLRGISWPDGGDFTSLLPFSNLQTILMDEDVAEGAGTACSGNVLTPHRPFQPFPSSLKTIHLYSNFAISAPEYMEESSLLQLPENTLAGMIFFLPSHPSLKTIYSPELPIDRYGFPRLSALEDKLWLKSRNSLKLACSMKKLKLVFMGEDEMKSEFGEGSLKSRVIELKAYLTFSILFIHYFFLHFSLRSLPTGRSDSKQRVV